LCAQCCQFYLDVLCAQCCQFYLDCRFVIAPSLFSDVYLYNRWLRIVILCYIYSFPFSFTLFPTITEPLPEYNFYIRNRNCSPFRSTRVHFWFSDRIFITHLKLFCLCSRSIIIFFATLSRLCNFCVSNIMYIL